MPAPVRDQESAGCPERRKDQAFGEKLFQQTGAAGPDGQPNRHFVTTRK